jgi:hypothetical protein
MVVLKHILVPFKLPKQLLSSLKKLIVSLLERYESIVRWIIILGTGFLMLYIIDQYLNLGVNPARIDKESVENQTIQTYKLFRNYFYLLWCHQFDTINCS